VTQNKISPASSALKQQGSQDFMSVLHFLCAKGIEKSLKLKAIGALNNAYSR
jgi:hypothetical protein